MSELGCLTAPQTILSLPAARRDAGLPFFGRCPSGVNLSINEIKAMLRWIWASRSFRWRAVSTSEIDAIVNFLGSEGSTFSASYQLRQVVASGGSWIRPLTALTSSDSNFAGISVGTGSPSEIHLIEPKMS